MTVPMTAPTASSAAMSPALMARQRALLLTELANRTQQANDCRVTVGELTGQTDSDSVLEREIADASAARIDEVVADIRAALERLDTGRYGVCERCGQPISVERLEAIPHARLCVHCPDQVSTLIG